MSLTTVSDRSLESWLWDAANILRGPVDASDFKAYVFPLLFLKRICDVYDEESAIALEESGGDRECSQLPEQHRFQIREGCHWTELIARLVTSMTMRGYQLAFPDSSDFDAIVRAIDASLEGAQ